MKLSVAISASSLSDESTKLDKTRKVSILARACAIFHVETIYVYGDDKDKNFLTTTLKYLETPQFLRKHLFPKMNDLKFAGVLHPLKIPSHTSTKKINIGDIREGVILSIKGKRFVYTGLNNLIPYHGKQKINRRITIQFKQIQPIIIKEINDTPQYWGYLVKERANLQSLLSEWNHNIILTSRKGKPATPNIINNKPTLIVFGTPQRSIEEILDTKKIQNAKSLNFFIDQATETIRLEEAVLGVLSIINAYDKNV